MPEGLKFSPVQKSASPAPAVWTFTIENSIFHCRFCSNRGCEPISVSRTGKVITSKTDFQTPFRKVNSIVPRLAVVQRAQWSHCSYSSMLPRFLAENTLCLFTQNIIGQSNQQHPTFKVFPCQLAWACWALSLSASKAAFRASCTDSFKYFSKCIGHVFISGKCHDL